MKQFHYKLEKVLALRARREEEAKIALGRAVGELNILEARIRTGAGEQAGAASRRFAPGNSLTEIHYYDRYISRLELERERLIKEKAVAETQVEAARQGYLEASRERKILDKHQEKRRLEYRRAAAAEEIRLTDDMSGGVRARQLAAGLAIAIII
ncbi:MAG: flagellar export protein FliJ [Treponema sp.]|nr:flagellar export protein FliJ [Treponema sp.]